MVNWYNFDQGREFTFVSSTFDQYMVKQLVDTGFYWMGDPNFVVCCACLQNVKITADTRSDHRTMVPDCFTLRLNITVQGVLMPATVGMFTAEDALKDVLRDYRRTHSIASRSRTFGPNGNAALAVEGFIRKGEMIECTYCHYQTNDWNTDTIKQRHSERCGNCIFIGIN